MNPWTCGKCGAVILWGNYHMCYYQPSTVTTTGTTWTVPMGTSTILGTAAYPYTTPYPPPKPIPYWQKHKREPKWHLYANGQTLCDGFSESWVYNTNQIPTPEYVVASNPPSQDKCEDCLAEYAALKLQDKVE